MASDFTDPINALILSVSEDKLAGFHEEPFAEIASRTGLDEYTVTMRIRAMLEEGVIRRVRQTLLATNLAKGALVAWKVEDPDKLESAFQFMHEQDPFSGHVVLRSTDRETAGSNYKLWTTLKVPPPSTLEEHSDLLLRLTGADSYKLMPAKGIFVLGVGHTRRKTIEPGEKAEEPATMTKVELVELTGEQWNVLLSLKRELEPEEIGPSPWKVRAAEAGVSLEDFIEVARQLEEKKVIGRFSTFLEHVKPSSSGERVTRFNGLFHWAVPSGMEEEAGSEVGRHFCLTHCYWREAGPEFGNVNIMGVVHGTQKERVLAHKAAIDEHLKAVGIPVDYTNVFWGGRSEIKPSEISPEIHREWMQKHAA